MIHQVAEYQALIQNFNSCYIMQVDLSYIYIYRYKSIIYRFIIDPHNDQLPVGVLAQLVEHCRSMGSSPVQAFLAQEKSSLTDKFP